MPGTGLACTALEEHADAYPALLAALPMGTEGEAEAGFAAPALAEIGHFRRGERWTYGLVDEDANAPARVAEVTWVGATEARLLRRPRSSRCGA